jgi:hypothetical protein
MMNRKLRAVLLVVLAAPLFGESGKTIMLGGNEGWLRVARMDGVNVQTGVRPQPVLMPGSTHGTTVGASTTAGASVVPDMALRFDETSPQRYRDTARHYTVSASAGVYAAQSQWAYAGGGAAIFDRSGAAFVTVKSASPEALLADNNRMGSFSIEFFLYSRVVENNAGIFSWNAVLPGGKTQFIRMSVEHNKIALVFDEFFMTADNTAAVTVRLSSKQALVPEKYSHHLVRFDRDTGLIEYLVNGVLEDVRYTTKNGRESGPANEIFEPSAGRQGELTIGKGFNGIIDEFNLYSGFIETAEMARFSTKPAWIETETFDLGVKGASVSKVLAAGGYVRADTAGGNRYAGSLGGQNVSHTASLRSASMGTAETFPDGSAIQLFVRAQESPFGWEKTEWTAVRPGAPLNVKGRYAQLSAAFYPSADQSGVPYLASLSLEYLAADPLAPPAQIAAAAGDGFVELKWKRNPQPGVGGYLVHIGTKSGEYWERPPIDAGNAESLHIDGLENGVLYYFAILSYSEQEQVDGIFSKEIRARPLFAVRQAVGL